MLTINVSYSSVTLQLDRYRYAAMTESNNGGYWNYIEASVCSSPLS